MAQEAPKRLAGYTAGEGDGRLEKMQDGVLPMEGPITAKAVHLSEQGEKRNIKIGT
jgi:hypothetical protein